MFGWAFLDHTCTYLLWTCTNAEYEDSSFSCVSHNKCKRVCNGKNKTTTLQKCHHSIERWTKTLTSGTLDVDITLIPLQLTFFCLHEKGLLVMTGCTHRAKNFGYTVQLQNLPIFGRHEYFQGWSFTLSSSDSDSSCTTIALSLLKPYTKYIDLVLTGFIIEQAYRTVPA